MPKFRPLPAIASAPISRITPDIEKNHFDAPMKSKRAAARAARWRRARTAAAAACVPRSVQQDRLRREHGGEQRDDRAEAEHEREAVHARRGEDEQDERDEQRDDVGVDDRREALLVALAMAAASICRARTSSLTRSKMTMFASAATPSVRIRPAMPGSVRTTGMSLTSA